MGTISLQNSEARNITGKISGTVRRRLGLDQADGINGGKGLEVNDRIIARNVVLERADGTAELLREAVSPHSSLGWRYGLASDSVFCRLHSWLLSCASGSVFWLNSWLLFYASGPGSWLLIYSYTYITLYIKYMLYMH